MCSAVQRSCFRLRSSSSSPEAGSRLCKAPAPAFVKSVAGIAVLVMRGLLTSSKKDHQTVTRLPRPPLAAALVLCRHPKPEAKAEPSEMS